MPYGVAGAIMFILTFALRLGDCEIYILIALVPAKYHRLVSGFGGLVGTMLDSGTQVRGFKPGRRCRIFRAKKS
jgi:hypothetical protein